MLRLIKQVFIGLEGFSRSLATKTNVSKFAKCISLNYQPSMTINTVINLNPDEYNQGLRYSQLTANLGRCNVSCNV